VGHTKDRWKDPARAGTGLRWQVWYQVDGRQTCGGSYPTKAVADRKRVELEASVHRGQWVDPTDPTRVTDLVRSFAATRMHKPRTAERVESLIRNHLEVTPLGARRAVSVRPSEVQAWASDRARVLAPLTLRNLVSLVRAAFSAAVLDRIVPASPFQRIALPRVEQARIVPLTVEQVAAVVEVIGPRYRAMVIAQAALGLRIGELLALRAEDLDFLRRTVRIEHQVDRKTRALVAPKTPRSRRTVPLPDVVSSVLAAHMQAHPPAASDLLFHTRDGLPLAHDWYANKVFAKAAARAKLPAGTTTHDLRHHYASVLLASGQSVVAVAELLGHENATLVLTTYGHLLPGGEVRARKAIDTAWNAVSEGAARAATAQGRPE
jgi:integrase